MRRIRAAETLINKLCSDPVNHYSLFMDIDTSTKVGSILRDYPELTDWFMDMGLCGCGNDSSMMWTLERLAREKNIDVAALLDDINKRIT